MEGDDDERREDKCENLQLYCRKVRLSLSLSLSQEINCQLVHALHPLFPLVLQGQ
jgi:hypothetical protein